MRSYKNQKRNPALSWKSLRNFSTRRWLSRLLARWNSGVGALLKAAFFGGNGVSPESEGRFGRNGWRIDRISQNSAGFDWGDFDGRTIGADERFIPSHGAVAPTPILRRRLGTAVRFSSRQATPCELRLCERRSSVSFR